MTPNNRRRNVAFPTGFTLVELVLAIVVIGGLVLLLMVALQRVQEKGKMAKCIGNLRQIVVAIHSYAQDQQGHIPLYGITKNHPMVTFWPGALAPYYFNQEATSTRMVGYGKWGCPAAENPNGYSYGVNYTGNTNPPIFTYPQEFLIGGEMRFMARGPRLINLSGNTMLVMDSHHMMVYNPKGWSLTDGESNAAFLPIKYNYAAFERHNLTINACFVDGSVRNIRLEDWKVNKDHMWGY